MPNSKTPKSNPIIAPEDRIPFWQKMALGSGGIINPFIAHFQHLILIVFNQGLGISPGILTTVAAIFRGWDAVSDPVIGSITDNARTRFGRRRPYIVAGAILFGLTSPLLWQVSPNASEIFIIGWIIVAGIILYTCTSLWCIPWSGLAMEMSPDSNERTRLMGYKAMFGYIGQFFIAWVPRLMILPIFAGPLLVSGEPNLLRGMARFSWVLAVFIIVIGVLPGLFTRERYYEKGLTRKQKRVSLFESVRETVTCRPFLIILTMMIFQVVGGLVVLSMTAYVSRYYVCRGDFGLAAGIMGAIQTATLPISVLSLALWAKLSEMWGKKTVIAIILLINIFGKILIYFFYTPDNPWLMAVPAVFLSFSGSSMWMILMSILSDVIDYDELKNGLRREGVFTATFTFCIKLCSSLAMLVSGWILVLTGFNAKLGPDQPMDVLLRMRDWFVFVPIGFWIVTLLLLYTFPINAARAREIRTELEAKRGKV